MDNIFAVKLSKNEKFTNEEVTPDLTTAAEVWLFAYEGNFEFLTGLKASVREGQKLGRGAIRGVLNCMLADMARRRTDELDCGMYRLDGEIYKVQKSRQSKRLYAKHLIVVNGNRLNDATEEIEHFDFEYAPGAIKMLKPENRMTLEEAQEFGIRYGICCVCGKFLKDAKSVSLGIGPVCRKGV